jgi:hypothetical protein
VFSQKNMWAGGGHGRELHFSTPLQDHECYTCCLVKSSRQEILPLSFLRMANLSTDFARAFCPVEIAEVSQSLLGVLPRHSQSFCTRSTFLSLGSFPIFPFLSSGSFDSSMWPSSYSCSFPSSCVSSCVGSFSSSYVVLGFFNFLFGF